MKIEASNYSIHYNEKVETLIFKGKLRINSIDDTLEELLKIFDVILEKEPTQITLDLINLELLNSLGISTISKFIIKIRNKKIISVDINASSKILWQNKSLINLKKIMPSLNLVWK